MRYPINEEIMAGIYKEELAAEGSEFNERDDTYIRRLTEVVNRAYEAGVRETLKKIQSE